MAGLIDISYVVRDDPFYDNDEGEKTAVTKALDECWRKMMFADDLVYASTSKGVRRLLNTNLNVLMPVHVPGNPDLVRFQHSSGQGRLYDFVPEELGIYFTTVETGTALPDSVVQFCVSDMDDNLGIFYIDSEQNVWDKLPEGVSVILPPLMPESLDEPEWLGDPERIGNAVTGVMRTDNNLWTPVYVPQGDSATVRFQVRTQMPGFHVQAYDSVSNAHGVSFTATTPTLLDSYIPDIVVRFKVHSQVGGQVVGQYYYIDEMQSIWSDLPENGRRTRIRDPGGRGDDSGETPIVNLLETIGTAASGVLWRPQNGPRAWKPILDVENQVVRFQDGGNPPIVHDDVPGTIGIDFRLRIDIGTDAQFYADAPRNERIVVGFWVYEDDQMTTMSNRGPSRRRLFIDSRGFIFDQVPPNAIGVHAEPFPADRRSPPPPADGNLGDSVKGDKGSGNEAEKMSHAEADDFDNGAQYMPKSLDTGAEGPSIQPQNGDLPLRPDGQGTDAQGTTKPNADTPTGDVVLGPLEDDPNLYPPVKDFSPSRLMSIIRAAGFRRERIGGQPRGSFGDIGHSASASIAKSSRRKLVAASLKHSATSPRGF